MRGFFITFDGIEGSGKTTQARALAEELERRGIPVKLTREPGGSPVGDRIRTLLLADSSLEMSPLAEFLLFAASRAEHSEKLIRPCLEEGYVVVSDRFADSSLAYQGFGKGVPESFIREVNETAAWGVHPDLTFLLDISPEDSAKRVMMRMKAEGIARDRLELEKADFYRRASEGYRSVAGDESSRFRIMDGTLPAEEIRRRVLDAVLRELKKAGLDRSEKGYIGGPGY